MKTVLDNMFYLSSWKDCQVEHYEGFDNMMVDFHMHDYFEVSLILSGKVKVLLSDSAQEGTGAMLVLSAPKTPHFIYNDKNVKYERVNLLFSEDFMADYLPEWKQIRSIFKEKGNVIMLNDEQKGLCVKYLDEINSEVDVFRKRLNIYCFLSNILDIDKSIKSDGYTFPNYVTGALDYIANNYNKKIIAKELAWQLSVGRTTLMTGFKNYTGSTLNEYVLRCRIKKAIILLKEGVSEEEVSERCGFGDVGSLIRAFKKCFNLTPKKYLRTI